MTANFTVTDKDVVPQQLLSQNRDVLKHSPLDTKHLNNVNVAPKHWLILSGCAEVKLLLYTEYLIQSMWNVKFLRQCYLFFFFYIKLTAVEEILPCCLGTPLKVTPPVC